MTSENGNEVISGQSKPVTLGSTTRVSDLANMLGVDPVELIKQLMRLGHMTVSYTHLTLPTSDLV